MPCVGSDLKNDDHHTSQHESYRLALMFLLQMLVRYGTLKAIHMEVSCSRAHTIALGLSVFPAFIIRFLSGFLAI
jgi:hypothetical protein